MDVKVKVTDEDGQEKEIKAVDVSVKGCLLRKLSLFHANGSEA